LKGHEFALFRESGLQVALGGYESVFILYQPS
jgi:hypothetical protein